MKARPILLALAAFLLLPHLGLVASQTQSIVQLDVNLPRSFQLVARTAGDPAAPSVARFDFTYRDVSIESFNSASGGAEPHLISAAAAVASGYDEAGWSVSTPFISRVQTTAGAGGDGFFEVLHDPGVLTSNLAGTLTLKITSTTANSQNQTIVLPWFIRILPTPAARIEIAPGSAETIAPYRSATFAVQVTNVDAYPASFRIFVDVLETEGIAASDVQIAGVGVRYIAGSTTETIPITIVAPRAKFWYNDLPMILSVGVQPVDGGAPKTVTHVMTVSGFYVSENLILLIIAALAQIALFIFLIIFARRAYERRYLGRPIPPWHIPEEITNLERLKREDPRAHYVLRYFLMEEEYRSALLWFYAFKKISKRRLKAEIKAIELREKADELVSVPSERFEKASGRVQRRYAKRMERAEAATQKRIDRLQSKLERTHEKDFEKDHEKWGKKVEKLQRKHNKPYVKAKAKWDKQTKAILEKWEKPFRKEKAKYEAKLAKAKEAYAKKVKKVDKDTWRVWREQMEDWEQENKLRKKEGRELVAEPPLVSAAAGPADLPPPFQEPPKPELPPEPQPANVVDLPPEPRLATPDLWASHYAKKARKAQRKGAKNIRALELEMAEKLNKLHHKREEAGVKVEEKREKLIAESQNVPVGSATFVDRVLRRSSADIDRRHHVAYLRGLTKERIKELEEAEEAAIERVRIQGERAQADLEAKILVERAEVRKENQMGRAQEGAARSERVASLVRQLGELKIQNQKALAQEQRESKQRLEAGVARLKAEERERIDQELGRTTPAAEAQPSKS